MIRVATAAMQRSCTESSRSTCRSATPTPLPRRQPILRTFRRQLPSKRCIPTRLPLPSRSRSAPYPPGHTRVCLRIPTDPLGATALRCAPVDAEHDRCGAVDRRSAGPACPSVPSSGGTAAAARQRWHGSRGEAGSAPGADAAEETRGQRVGVHEPQPIRCALHRLTGLFHRGTCTHLMAFRW